LICIDSIDVAVLKHEENVFWVLTHAILSLGYIFVNPYLFNDSFKGDAVISSEGNQTHAVLFLLEFVSYRNKD